MKNFDYEKAHSILDEREKNVKKHNANLLAKAKEDFEKILLVAIKYAPERIYQWGSVLEEEGFSEISDIDIAVEGIKKVEDFFAMHKEIEALTEFSVDLIQMEKIEPEFREIIKMKGKIVYERNQQKN